jgi:hypothetical protein
VLSNFWNYSLFNSNSRFALKIGAEIPFHLQKISPFSSTFRKINTLNDKHHFPEFSIMPRPTHLWKRKSGNYFSIFLKIFLLLSLLISSFASAANTMVQPAAENWKPSVTLSQENTFSVRYGGGIISLHNLEEPTTLRIYNINGELIAEKSHNRVIYIGASNWAAGTYVAEVQQNDFKQTEKLVLGH